MNDRKIDAAPSQADALLQVENLGRSFDQGGETVRVLQGLNMSLDRGEMVALVGPSGAGKSTLLQQIGLLDTPTAGRIVIAGRDVTGINDMARTKLRQSFIGFVYQFHYLQPEFSALENVAMPQMIAGVPRREAQGRAMELLTSMGLSHRTTHRPARLSGGEQQRVAIARALANRPKLLLADEPTGNLDPKTSAEVFDILIGLARKTGIGALIATHNMDLAEQMDRVLELKGGRVVAY